METALLSETTIAFDGDTARRALLVTASNPGPEHDMLVTVTETISFDDPDAQLLAEIRYVPDKRVLDVENSHSYWQHHRLQDRRDPEAMAATVLADFNNEIVPRWVQVLLVDQRRGHQVVITDRQPAWDNPHLLARLRLL